FLDNHIRRWFQNPKKITGPYVGEGDTVVDLGCGPGFFSIDMAQMVGEQGQVFSVDLQEEMLSKVAYKSALKKLTGIIRPHQCTQKGIGLPDTIQADFILAYYMVHETLDHEAFLSEVKTILAPDGRLLIVEPPIHVSSEKFREITRAALNAGFEIIDRPKGKGGKSLLLGIDRETIEAGTPAIN
ncbi:MAG TPA: SAM-dependent methyltransferase, partial [Desulfobacteraceae bacterium]|nr:SAM-dependent methyltransferase [Desulfobacteraceae bacterium]